MLIIQIDKNGGLKQQNTEYLFSHQLKELEKRIRQMRKGCVWNNIEVELGYCDQSERYVFVLISGKNRAMLEKHECRYFNEVLTCFDFYNFIYPYSTYGDKRDRDLYPFDYETVE